MKIGFSVQGCTDRAFLRGLHRRWCAEASLIEGPFRGSTGESLRREYRKICDGFRELGVDVMIFLTDADNEAWRDVQRNERGRFPPDRLDWVVHGVADRNVECWLCAAPEWLAQELNASPAGFRSDDPKAAFEQALGVTRDDRKENEVIDLVLKAPLRQWLGNRSFEDFYEQVRDLSQRLGCALENLRE